MKIYIFLIFLKIFVNYLFEERPETPFILF